MSCPTSNLSQSLTHPAKHLASDRSSMCPLLSPGPSRHRFSWITARLPCFCPGAFLSTCARWPQTIQKCRFTLPKALSWASSLSRTGEVPTGACMTWTDEKARVQPCPWRRAAGRRCHPGQGSSVQAYGFPLLCAPGALAHFF